MASLLTEDQFTCCICLDIFTNPVSIPCGHNFCLTCIKSFWDMRGLSVCPLCKESFRRRPELRINHAFADITEQFRKSLRVRVEPAAQYDDTVAGRPPRVSSRPQAVSCDMCPGVKPRAVKSCLVCQTSYCETHLAPHLREPALQRHGLTDPATFVTRGLCRKHDCPLEVFCRSDQTPVCVRCTETDHKAHSMVPMERESKKMRLEMKKIGTEVQQMVQTRLRKVDEVKRSVKISRISAERELEGSVQVFSDLVRSIQRIQAELVQEMEGKQRAAETRAEGLVEDLEREIAELQRRSAELERLSRTDDHLYLLQSFPSLSTPPLTKDWSEVSVHSEPCVGTVRRAVSRLADVCKELEETLSDAELRRTQEYAVEVTLDPVTAASWLVLSADGKQVSLRSQQASVPVQDDPKRFDSCVCVLGKQGFSTGRRYWAVQVGEKTDWDVGVARESINRKGSITVRPDQGFWAVCRRKGGGLQACAGPSVPLSLRQKPQKVGVFVDYEEGLVSFYDVEARVHIYSFAGCVFAETLYPYFNPCLHDDGKNTAPLVICAVEGGARPEPLPRGVPSETTTPPQSVSGRSRRPSVRSVSHQTLF